MHGDKYDYSRVVWVDRYATLEIVCPQHGSFYQNYNTHAGSKAGCPKCGLTRRAFHPFSDTEVDYLKRLFETDVSKETIMEFLPGHSWSSISGKANKLGLKSPRKNWRPDRLSHVLEPTTSNAYLWGLLYADGYLSKRGGLSVSLWTKDKAYLELLSKHFNFGPLKKADGKGSMLRVEVNDKANVNKLKAILDYRDRKTYNPPSHFDFLSTPEMRLAFLIGLTDGDGCLTFDHNLSFKHLRIVQHRNWYPFLQALANRISQDTGLQFTVNDTNARGNASLYMGKKAQHAYLVGFLEHESLPVLARKWYNKGRGYNQMDLRPSSKITES